jgi:hypothetical protein
MKELVSRFAQVRSDLLETVKDFPADRVEEVVFGKWDLKSVLAHVAGWDSYFTEIVRLMRAGEKIPYWGNIDKYNEASVEKRKGRTFDQVYDEFVRAGEAFIWEYGDLEKGLWNKRFWEQGSSTPAWVVEINVEHYESHMEKIKKKLSD